MSATMPLTIKPTFDKGVGKKANVRILRTDFGDGYSQRTADGINARSIILTLNWVGSTANIQELITHFEERNGYQTFTINDATIADDTDYKWTCEEWDYNHIGENLMTLTATLKQEFDL